MGFSPTKTIQRAWATPMAMQNPKMINRAVACCGYVMFIVAASLPDLGCGRKTESTWGFILMIFQRQNHHGPLGKSILMGPSSMAVLNVYRRVYPSCITHGNCKYGCLQMEVPQLMVSNGKSPFFIGWFGSTPMTSETSKWPSHFRPRTGAKLCGGPRPFNGSVWNLPGLGSPAGRFSAL